MKADEGGINSTTIIQVQLLNQSRVGVGGLGLCLWP